MAMVVVVMVRVLLLLLLIGRHLLRLEDFDMLLFALFFFVVITFCLIDLWDKNNQEGNQWRQTTCMYVRICTDAACAGK